MTPEGTKVVQWFERIDWIQAGGRITAILVVTFVLMFIARRLISGLERFTALHAHDIEAKKRAATVSNILRKLATCESGTSPARPSSPALLPMGEGR